MKNTAKRLLWTAGIMILCLADQQKGSAIGEIQLVVPNMVMIVIGVFAITHYPLKSFCRLPYYVWLGVSLLAGSIIMMNRNQISYFPKELLSQVILVVVYGLLMIRTIWALFIEGAKPSINRLLLLLAVIFFLLAMVSKHDAYWNLIYFMCYILVYCTAFSKEEMDIFSHSLTDGIIISFFIVQSMAFVFRPYDMLRYMGMYSNTNMNALMYVMIYCAFLGKFCLLHRNGKTVGTLEKLWKWLCFLLACSMWSFVLLTMCRSAFLGMGAATVLCAVWFVCRYAGKKIWFLVKSALLWGLLVVACFPLVYGAVRYLPPVFHHPLYFYEGYSEERVNSLDSWDSPKYVDWKTILEENFGRFRDLLFWLPQEEQAEGQQQIEMQEGVQQEIQENAVEQTQSETQPSVVEQSQSETQSSVEEQAQEAPQANVEEQAQEVSKETNQETEQKSTSIRVTIYRHYLTSLNLWGHRQEENGIQISEEYFAPHAHDLFLQYLYNYGIVAGIVFSIFTLYGGFGIVKLAFDKKRDKSCYITAAMIYLSIIVFGLTEMMWQNGMMSHALLWLLPVMVTGTLSKKG